MNLEQIKTFLTVYQLGSFQKASEELFLPQPTVSHRIHQLEKSLGKKLILRKKSGNVLTLEGEAFYPYALKLLEVLEQGQVAVDKAARQEEILLEVCCTNSLSALYLSELLRGFVDRFPQTSIKVHSFATEEVIHAIRMGTCFLGLSRYSVDDPDLTFRLINNEHIYFVVSHKHPLSRRKSISLSEVVQQPLVMYQRGKQYRETVEFVFKRMNLPFQVKYEMNNMELIKQMVIGNYGTTLFAPSYMGRELNSGTLVKIPIVDNPFPMRQTFLVHKKDTQLTSVVKLFYDHILTSTPLLTEFASS